MIFQPQIKLLTVFVVLSCIPIVLKTFGVIGWTWVFACLPLMVVTLFFLALMLIALTFIFIVWIADPRKGQRRNK